MLKQISAVVLCVCLVFSCVACSSGSSVSADDFRILFTILEKPLIACFCVVLAWLCIIKKMVNRF